ncbi:hypothetical protein AMS68_007953 [Peltaster fructicola]|uniref:Uncharacterized protein n=1 Tax=Peltaster fructicola TaxID=286661 RepID=A0A6H0Y621_9PEZI|nr:hypothetical protein AMS68_007953 [Peltaster fructicola]
MLRIRNDPRHSSVYHVDDLSLDYLKGALQRLARLAVCSDGMPSQPAARIYESVVHRVDCFERKKILSGTDATELRAKLETARRQPFADMLSDLAKDESRMASHSQVRHMESSQWTVPERHTLPGDPNPPWHELPAGNGLHLRRIARQRGAFKSGALPSGGFMLLNRGRKASEAVQKDVKDMLEEAKRCFDTYTNVNEVEDIDALGNLVWKKETGRRRRTHYGHSYENIEAKRDQQGQRNERAY